MLIANFTFSVSKPAWLVFLCCLCFVSPLQAKEIQKGGVETDDELMKEVREMFAEPFQEEDYFRTDRLLITATGSQKPVHLAPSVATVITAEDIKNMGLCSLNEILETVPGLHVAPSGFVGFNPVWTIRGIYASLSPHVLLLVNGIPVTDHYAANQSNTLNRMPVAMISRVEVIRGPGSSLYGADAFSGVVNVITRDNFEIAGTRVGVRHGSFDTSAGWLQHGARYGGFDVALGAEWQRSDGDDNRIVEQDYMHAIGQARFSNAPGPLPTDYEVFDTHITLRRNNWTMHLKGSLYENGKGPGLMQAITYNNEFDNVDILAHLQYDDDHLSRNWELHGKLFYHYVHKDYMIEIVPQKFMNMWGNPIRTNRDSGMEASMVFKGLPDQSLRWGAGIQFFDINTDQTKNFGPVAAADPFGQRVQVSDPDDIFMADQNSSVWHLLIQDEWHLARSLDLTAGLRYDEYSDFGSTTNPRLALVWEMRYDLIGKVLYGQAFRAPAYGELYVKNNPQSVGNANLEPEEIETLELALDYQPAPDLHSILSIFAYRAEGLIEAIGPLPAVFQNYGEQEGHGFELELEWQAATELKIRANIAYQRSRNTRTAALIHDTPEIQAALNPHWQFLPDWSLNGQFSWIAKRHRAPEDPRPDIDDFFLVHLTLRRANIAQHWNLALAVRNLLDEDGREPSPYDSAAPYGAFIPNDYPMEGRAMWVELRYEL